MARAKKILNDPTKVVDESQEGLVLATHGELMRVSDSTGIVRTDIPDGKLAFLIGGGSGHEPPFSGFVGKNMADGAACGEVFAAPSPDIILATVRAIHRGRGVLCMHGNYAGDNMNFDMAVELARDEGIDMRTLRVNDDVASAPPERAQERRGIGGDIYVIKVAGGATAELDDLDAAYRIAAKARDNVRTMAVAVSAGSIPETGKRTFELADDEIEIGMGGHGEPGIARQKLTTADDVTDQMMSAIIRDLPFRASDEVALLINNLGATTMMELLIVNRRVRKILADAGINVYRTDLGTWLTVQEMAGFSITLMRLDDELKHYLDLPCKSFGFVNV